MKFSHCGQLLATAGQDKNIMIWVVKDSYDHFKGDLNSRVRVDQSGRLKPPVDLGLTILAALATYRPGRMIEHPSQREAFTDHMGHAPCSFHLEAPRLCEFSLLAPILPTEAGSCNQITTPKLYQCTLRRAAAGFLFFDNLKRDQV